MKKRTLSLLLALVMCLSLLPVTALAADTPAISNLTVVYDNDAGQCYLTFTLKNANATYDAIYGQYSADGGEWVDLDVSSIDSGACQTYRSDDLSADKYIRYRVHFLYFPDSYGPWSNVLTLNEPVELKASEWAKKELAAASELGLIPGVLAGADLTKDITRAEFAAVCVKVYEALSGTAAIPVVNNPFTDTKDVEVLKAFNIGAVNGTSATTFAPNDLLSREQAAAMLTRVFKRITLAGWTLATDSQFSLTYTKPATFADDKDISAWAKDSVYFMVANEIIKGVGSNNFAPKNVTDKQSADGYANATREQALLIAVRMVQNLGN